MKVSCRFVLPITFLVIAVGSVLSGCNNSKEAEPSEAGYYSGPMKQKPASAPPANNTGPVSTVKGGRIPTTKE